MTVAVCLRCGEFKHGAFNPCRSCGYTPDDDESLTKHLLVTAHYHSREPLEALSARVKAGEPVTFDLESLQAAWVGKAALDAEAKRIGRGCAVGCVVLSRCSSVRSSPPCGVRGRQRPPGGPDDWFGSGDSKSW